MVKGSSPTPSSQDPGLKQLCPSLDATAPAVFNVVISVPSLSVSLRFKAEKVRTEQGTGSCWVNPVVLAVICHPSTSHLGSQVTNKVAVEVRR